MQWYATTTCSSQHLTLSFIIRLLKKMGWFHSNIRREKRSHIGDFFHFHFKRIWYNYTAREHHDIPSDTAAVGCLAGRVGGLLPVWDRGELVLSGCLTTSRGRQRDPGLLPGVWLLSANLASSSLTSDVVAIEWFLLGNNIYDMILLKKTIY